MGGWLTTLGVALFAVRHAPAPALLAITPLLLAIAVTAWSGNLNAYLLGATAVVWWCGMQADRRAQAVAGVAVALAASLKLGPAVLIVWLLARRSIAGVIASVVTGIVLVAVTLLVGGSDPLAEFLAVAASTTGAAHQGFGVAALLDGLGVRPGLARLAPPALLATTAFGAIALRSRPRASFAVAVVGGTIGLPVLRHESLALLLGATLPWVLPPNQPFIRPVPGRALALAGMACVALAGTAATNATTSVGVVENRTDRPVTVRFYYQGIPESFGFRLGPGQVGRGWGPLLGAVSGPVRAFDDTCRLVAVGTSPREGGWFTVEDSALSVRKIPDYPDSSVLPFTNACAYTPTALMR